MNTVYTQKELEENILSTRIRLARNIRGEKFRIDDEKKAKEIVKEVSRTLNRIEDFDLYFVSQMQPLLRECFKEKYLLSSALLANEKNGAVLIDKDENLSIMVHEEDVLREQCIMRGFRLTEAYKKLALIDDALSKTIDFAYDQNLGYLTACPTNVGTGMRASVMLFLPALTECGLMPDIIKKIEELGLTVRGVYGEGSSADGYYYQISNEVTLGISERGLLDEVEDTVLTVCQAERATAKEYYGKIPLKTADRANRAFGILSSAYILSYEEFLRLISAVKLGYNTGVLELKNPQIIDELTMASRPATLSVSVGRELKGEETDEVRAHFVKQQMKLIGGN